MFNADIRKRPAENVFRTGATTRSSMATVTHSTSRAPANRINLGGTNASSSFATYGSSGWCSGRHTFYGAAADSPLFHTEQEPPMAVSTFPGSQTWSPLTSSLAPLYMAVPGDEAAVLRSVCTLSPSRHGIRRPSPRPRRDPGLKPLSLRP